MKVYVVTFEHSMGGEMYTSIIGVGANKDAAHRIIYCDRELENVGAENSQYDIFERELED